MHRKLVMAVCSFSLSASVGLAQTTAEKYKDAIVRATADRSGAYISLTGEPNRDPGQYHYSSEGLSVAARVDLHHNIADLVYAFSANLNRGATNIDAENMVRDQLEPFIKRYISLHPNEGVLVQVHEFQEPSTGQVGVAGVYVMGQGTTPQEAFNQWQKEPSQKIIPGLPPGMADSPETSFRVWYKKIGETVMPVPLYQRPGLEEFTGVKEDQKHGLLWMQNLRDQTGLIRKQYESDKKAAEQTRAENDKHLADLQNQLDATKQQHTEQEKQRTDDLKKRREEQEQSLKETQQADAEHRAQAQKEAVDRQAAVENAEHRAEQQRDQAAKQEQDQATKLQQERDRIAKEQAEEAKKIQDEKDAQTKLEEEQKKHEEEQVTNKPLGKVAPYWEDEGYHTLPHNIAIFASGGNPDGTSQSKLSAMMAAIQGSPEKIGFVNPENGKAMIFSRGKR
jgi:hypothetical protein